MMKNLFAILAAIALVFTFASAETAQPGAVTVSFAANATTGYQWVGFVAGGDAVALESAEGAYVPDLNPDKLDGKGGQTCFTLIPAQPGESIVVFSYLRPWEPDAVEQRVLLASVDEQLALTVMDVTEGGVLHGTVISVDEAEHTALLNTEAQGDVAARFDESETLPVPDEQIVIYTNGAMTMSLPPIVNVIAWSTVPSDLAREEAAEPGADGNDPQVDGGTLVGMAYTCSGNEIDNLYRAVLERTEDGDLVLEIQESDAYNLPITISRYQAAPETLASIAALVNAADMLSWADREDEFQVCDAAHPYLHLHILNGEGEREDVSISAYIGMTDEELDTYGAVMDVMFANEAETRLMERGTISRE